MQVRILFIAFLGLLSYSLQAQVSGYLGKKLIIKTDLVDYLSYDKGYNIQAEYVIGRRQSLHLEYQVKQEGYSSYLNYLIPEIDYDPSSIALVDSWESVVSYRIYLSRGIPAPKGFYNYYQVAFGEADISGEYEIDRIESYDYKISNADYLSAEAGFGYQFFLFNILAVDTGFGFNYSTIDAEGSNQLIEEMRYRHGSNLRQFEERSEFFGVSLHLGVGVLLF